MVYWFSQFETMNRHIATFISGKKLKFAPRVQCHCVLLEINGERLTTRIVYVDKWVCLTLVHTQSLWVYWRRQRPWKNEWKIGFEVWASLSQQQQRCQKRGLTDYIYTTYNSIRGIIQAIHTYMKSLKYLWISSPFTFLGVTVLELYV